MSADPHPTNLSFQTRANMSSAFHAVLAGGGRDVANPVGARALLQIPSIPGDVVDPPQDQTPELIADFTNVDTPALDSGDASWMMTATALVLMMSIPGLSLFYGGLVRPKNVLNVVASAYLRHPSSRHLPGFSLFLREQHNTFWFFFRGFLFSFGI